MHTSHQDEVRKLCMHPDNPHSAIQESWARGLQLDNKDKPPLPFPYLPLTSQLFLLSCIITSQTSCTSATTADIPPLLPPVAPKVDRPLQQKKSTPPHTHTLFLTSQLSLLSCIIISLPKHYHLHGSPLG
jgi:hypothetical protein